MLRAVTFDFWNTLMRETPGSLREHRLRVWADAFAHERIVVDTALLAAANDEAHRAYEAAWRRAVQFRVEQAADLIVKRLGLVDVGRAREILVAGFSEGGRRARVDPSDGVRDCLSAIDRAGLKIGIVCDIGLTPSCVVRELLDREGLLEAFTATTFSDEVGHYKPAPEIFERALAGLGHVEARNAAHVGDRRRTDVAGALGAGMKAVRYGAVFDDEDASLPEANVVVHHLADMTRALGIA